MHKYKITFGVVEHPTFERIVEVCNQDAANHVALFCARHMYEDLREQCLVPSPISLARVLYPTVSFASLTAEQECEVFNAYYQTRNNSLIAFSIEI